MGNVKLEKIRTAFALLLSFKENITEEICFKADVQGMSAKEEKYTL